jgi:fatty acid-binding protein DegV
MREVLNTVTDRDLRIRLTSVVGAVIGTYVGPGAVALCCIQE